MEVPNFTPQSPELCLVLFRSAILTLPNHHLQTPELCNLASQPTAVALPSPCQPSMGSYPMETLNHQDIYLLRDICFRNQNNRQGHFKGQEFSSPQRQEVRISVRPHGRSHAATVGRSPRDRRSPVFQALSGVPKVSHHHHRRHPHHPLAQVQELVLKSECAYSLSR